MLEKSFCKKDFYPLFTEDVHLLCLIFAKGSSRDELTRSMNTDKSTYDVQNITKVKHSSYIYVSMVLFKDSEPPSIFCRQFFYCEEISET